MINKLNLQIVNWKEVYHNYGYDLSFIQDVFSEIQLDVKMEITELIKYLILKDYEKIYLISHKIKGTLGVLYCEESSNIMNDICIISKKGINEPSKEIMFQIKLLFNEFQEKFQEIKCEIDLHFKKNIK
jgi:hypothetical protein